MNYSTALFLILSSTAAASSSEAQHSTINKNRRSLTDLSYNDETHGAVSEAEYEELVNWREAITSYWTPDRLSSVIPLHNVINDGIDAIQSNSTHYLDNGTWRRNLRTTNNDGRKLAVTDSPWTGGDIHHAAGRLVFTKDGNNYLCSATAIKDGSMDNGRSIIVTAGHCVYDDATKKFASNFMFIPHQDDGGSDKSDLNCNNDKVYGCWTPKFAVVDKGWASRSWSANIPWDYAFLTVSDVGSHKGGPNPATDLALDDTVPAFDITFKPPNVGSDATALGYSGARDPDFRYCTQRLTRADASRGGYMLDGCGLTGGSSGGPWIQNLDSNGRGEVFAVNSYGPAATSPWDPKYMGGPQLHDNSAQCLFEFAKRVALSDAGQGLIVNWDSSSCDASTYVNSNGRTGTLPSPSTPVPTPNPTPNPTGDSDGGGEVTPAPTPNPTPSPTPSPTRARVCFFGICF